MQIRPISNISFQNMPMKKCKNFSIPEPFEIKTNKNETGIVKVKPEGTNSGKYSTNIYINSTTPIAQETFLNGIGNNIYCDEMTVGFKQPKNDTEKTANRNLQGKGLGTVLHLCDIIEMLENDKDYVNLYSTASAILFHAKCKFEPKFTADNADELSGALTSIATNRNPVFKPYVKTATELIHYRPKDINYYKSGTFLIKDVLDTAIENKVPKSEMPFQKGFHMILTKDKVINNKTFFNKLFEKYDIDYEIK